MPGFAFRPCGRGMGESLCGAWSGWVALQRGAHRTTRIQTCESGEALIEALKGKREFMLALARKQLRAQGNMAKLGLLKGVLEEIAAAQGGGGGQQQAAASDDAYPMLVPLPKSEWEPDGPACSQCQAKFSLTNRRHHCRCVVVVSWLVGLARFASRV